ncbi:hypothetical protein [Flavobacterium sp. PL12]|uniref:hypothetical protein n=1 Tax=Flavobacterium sp. PL12 TaxID=3071718 RepID=UPI00319E0FE6
MDQVKIKLLKQLSSIGDVTFFTENKKYIITTQEKTPLNTQANTVLHFFEKLDISMINSILDVSFTYQHFTKGDFIGKLDDAFNELLDAGDTYLTRHSGSCNSQSCNFNCKGYSFIGNNSNNYFDLIFDIKEGIVHDIYECSNFKCDEKNLKKNIMIEIDKSNMPF